MLRTLGAAASVGGLLCYKTSGLHSGLHHGLRPLMAEEASQTQFMAAPMSDLSSVTYNSDMRLRMESFIMGLQVRINWFCKPILYTFTVHLYCSDLRYICTVHLYCSTTCAGRLRRRRRAARSSEWTGQG